MQRWLGFVGAVVLWAILLGTGKADAGRMRRLDFSTSVQKMGVRFTERMRKVWRHRWIRLR